MSLPDLDKLSKDRRDWLEVFGNQWGVEHPQVEPLTAEEKQALADALNPWAKRPEAGAHRSNILADQAKTSAQVESVLKAEREWFIPVEPLTLEQFTQRYISPAAERMADRGAHQMKELGMFHEDAFSLIWPRVISS